MFKRIARNMFAIAFMVYDALFAGYTEMVFISFERREILRDAVFL